MSSWEVNSESMMVINFYQYIQLTKYVKSIFIIKGTLAEMNIVSTIISPQQNPFSLDLQVLIIQMLYKKNRQIQKQNLTTRKSDKFTDRSNHNANQPTHHTKSKYNQFISLDNSISSIEEVPPLFDRSIDSIIFNSPQQTHRSNFNSTFQFSKQGKQKYTDSIYIKDEDPDAKENRPLQTKAKTDKKEALPIEVIKQRKIGDNKVLQEWALGKKDLKQKKNSLFECMTLQLYNDIVENSNKFNDYEQKSGKEILAVLLTNPCKMEKFTRKNIEKQINIKYLKEMKNKMDISQERGEEQLNGYKYRKEVENLQILVCLLGKIQQGSILCGGELPEVNIERGGQINISFGNSKDKYRNIKMLGKFSKSIKSEKSGRKQGNEDEKKRKSEQMRNSERIRELQNNLEQKQRMMEQIHKGYEAIIQNYAESIKNILNKTKERVSRGKIGEKGKQRKLQEVKENRNLEQQSQQHEES